MRGRRYEREVTEALGRPAARSGMVPGAAIPAPPNPISNRALARWVAATRGAAQQGATLARCSCGGTCGPCGSRLEEEEELLDGKLSRAPEASLSRAVAGRGRTSVGLSAAPSPLLQRSPGDRVEYSGGQKGTLRVFKDGKEIKAVRAISGHPGSAEHEKDVGPTPAGTYTLHPQITNRTVTKMEDGVGGARAISRGYQEIQSEDLAACASPDEHHYCVQDCMVGMERKKCWTPKGVWGEKRMKIEGSATVKDPSGRKVSRGAFYIHGGYSSVEESSGCIKVFDSSVFDAIRQLKGPVPLIVLKPSGPAPSPGPQPQPVPPLPPGPGPGPAPRPVTGTVRTKGGNLNIRSGPSATASIVGSYPNGSKVPIICETSGTEVNGNQAWDRTDRGYIADAFVELDVHPPVCSVVDALSVVGSALGGATSVFRLQRAAGNRATARALAYVSERSSAAARGVLSPER